MELTLLRCRTRVKRDYVLAELAKIPGLSCPKPEGAFYVFPVISAYYGKLALICMCFDLV